MPKTSGNYGKASQPSKRMTGGAGKVMRMSMNRKPVGKMGGMK